MKENFADLPVKAPLHSRGEELHKMSPFTHKGEAEKQQQQMKKQIKLSHLSDNTAAAAFEEKKQMPSI